MERQTEVSRWHLDFNPVRDTSVQLLGELDDVVDSERAQRRPAPPSRVGGIVVIPFQR